MKNIEEISLLDIALQRWRLILLSTLGCTVLAALATEILPKRYGSEMEFLVKNGRQELTVSPERAPVAPPPAGQPAAEVD